MSGEGPAPAGRGGDQAAGIGARAVQGTIRDSLPMTDVWFNHDGGQRPDLIVTDGSSYSDLVFGLVSLLGGDCRPALADIPDQKGWRIGSADGYGPLATFARGKRVTLRPDGSPVTKAAARPSWAVTWASARPFSARPRLLFHPLPTGFAPV